MDSCGRFGQINFRICVTFTSLYINSIQHFLSTQILLQKKNEKNAELNVGVVISNRVMYFFFTVSTKPFDRKSNKLSSEDIINF